MSDNIKTELEEMRLKNVEWIRLALVKDQPLAVVKTFEYNKERGST
jgi:hypothetical protein